MYYYVLCFFIVNLAPLIQCSDKPCLRIIKQIDDNFIPVSSSIVEEFSGTKFSILCELVSSQDVNTKFIDNQVSWVKITNTDTNRSRDPDDKTTHPAKSADSGSSNSYNIASKRFEPLRPSDAGTYICVSLKYGMNESVEVVVIANKPKDESQVVHETLYCSEHMFQCTLNNLCIQQRFVCDGKQDCKDGSDESNETCPQDPCKDKIRCEDGRCIPTSWCCDRALDLNCTVTIKPPCCQLLSETYEEMEQFNIPNIKNMQSGDGRYLFISLCSLSIIFSMALFLLLVTKFVIFARKSAFERAERRNDISLYNQTNLLHSCRLVYSPCNLYTCHASTNRGANLAEACESSDPLFPIAERLCDHPPSYNELVTGGYLKEADPPPPYRSAERLDDDA